MTTRITAVVDEVRREGRDITTDDIRRAVKVPDAMAAQIVADPRPLTESLIFTWTVAFDLLNSGVAISGRWPRLLRDSQ
jgi:hypothetical protein